MISACNVEQQIFTLLYNIQHVVNHKIWRLVLIDICSLSSYLFYPFHINSQKQVNLIGTSSSSSSSSFLPLPFFFLPHVHLWSLQHPSFLGSQALSFAIHVSFLSIAFFIISRDASFSSLITEANAMLKQQRVHTMMTFISNKQ
ncbi:hypothetical protein X975_23696, partial [Stegodyphus mimosarum]